MQTLPDELRGRAQLLREASREAFGERRDSLLEDAKVLDVCAQRIDQLERRLTIWRDDYQRSPEGNITVPVHQIIDMIGEHPTRT